MLGRPQHGWTAIYFGKAVIGNASCLDDVPFMTIEAFDAYFGQKHKGLPVTFGITYDAEGYKFGLLEFDNDLYMVSNNTDGTHLDTKYAEPIAIGLPAYSNAETVIAALARECIRDIREYIDDWVSFCWDADENQIAWEARWRELNRKVDVLEKILDVHTESNQV